MTNETHCTATTNHVKRPNRYEQIYYPVGGQRAMLNERVWVKATSNGWQPGGQGTIKGWDTKTVPQRTRCPLKKTANIHLCAFHYLPFISTLSVLPTLSFWLWQAAPFKKKCNKQISLHSSPSPRLGSPCRKVNMSTMVSSDHADASLQVTVVLHSSAPTSNISAFTSSAE